MEDSLSSGNKDDENNQNVANRKSISFFSTSSVLPAISEKGESSAERSGKMDSIPPRQLNFDDEESSKKKEPDRPRINLFSKLQSNEKMINKSSSSSDSSWKTKTAEVNTVDSLNAPIEGMTVAKSNSIPPKSSDSMLTEPKHSIQSSETSHVKSEEIDSHHQSMNTIPKPSNNDDETPYKTFQMPQTSTMRRAQTSSQHRTLLSSANQPRKCRTDLENEFRSQKVLFTTPSAVSRPAMKALNHLGLDDSLNCYKSSPMVNNTLSPVREERNKGNKFSTNVGDGTNDLHQTVTCIAEEHLNAAEAVKVNEVVKENAPPPTTSNEEKKEKIITINKKDFIIQNKIGHGGSSSVFLVEHKETKLQCALKVRMIDLFRR